MMIELTDNEIEEILDALQIAVDNDYEYKELFMRIDKAYKEYCQGSVNEC